jgi:hypothetical protein
MIPNGIAGTRLAQRVTIAAQSLPKQCHTLQNVARTALHIRCLSAAAAAAKKSPYGLQWQSNMNPSTRSTTNSDRSNRSGGHSQGNTNHRRKRQHWHNKKRSGAAAINKQVDIVFPVRKPSGITSSDVVQRIKSTIGVNGLKVGHGGTLDPLASGVLGK